MILPIISLWMPWANWVALEWKPVETRLHRRFKNLVGRRIGIAASLKWDATAIQQARPYLTVEKIAQTAGFLQMGGAIICTANVVRFQKLDDSHSQMALIDCGTVERYGLFLRDVRHIEAIPCKGTQGIWYQEIPGGEAEGK